jgi:hypothetical protein
MKDATAGARWLIDHAMRDERVRQARAKAGLAGISGNDFECPACGGLADVRGAMAERDRLVVEVLELTLVQ